MYVRGLISTVKRLGNKIGIKYVSPSPEPSHLVASRGNSVPVSSINPSRNQVLGWGGAGGGR
jgi:hypothetical protein